LALASASAFAFLVGLIDEIGFQLFIDSNFEFTLRFGGCYSFEFGYGQKLLNGGYLRNLIFELVVRNTNSFWYRASYAFYLYIS